MYYGCIRVPFQRVRTSRLLLHSPQLAPQMLLFQAGDEKKNVAIPPIRAQDSRLLRFWHIVMALPL